MLEQWDEYVACLATWLEQRKKTCTERKYNFVVDAMKERGFSAFSGAGVYSVSEILHIAGTFSLLKFSLYITLTKLLRS